MYGLGHPVETLQSKVVDEARIGTSWSCKEVERTSGCAVSSRWALAKTWQSRCQDSTNVNLGQGICRHVCRAFDVADVVDELCDVVQVMCLVGRMLPGFVVSSYMEVPTLNEVTEVFH